MYRLNKDNPPNILVFEADLNQLLTFEEIGAYQINYYYLSNGMTLSHHSKNQWSGHFIKGNWEFNNGYYSQITMLNCQSFNNKFDQIFGAILKTL